MAKQKKLSFNQMAQSSQEAIRSSTMYQKKLEDEIDRLKNEITNKNINDLEIYKEVPDNLTEIENQIQNLKSRMWEVAWYIGKRLIVINDNFINETGYENITEYSMDRFGLSRDLTYQFMRIANKFNLVDACQHGSKLRIITSLKDEKANKYLKWMSEEKPTFREIQNKLNQERRKINRGRPSQVITIKKSRVTIDLNKMNIEIPKERQNDFFTALDKTCRDFGILNNT